MCAYVFLIIHPYPHCYLSPLLPPTEPLFLPASYFFTSTFFCVHVCACWHCVYVHGLGLFTWTGATAPPRNVTLPTSWLSTKGFCLPGDPQVEAVLPIPLKPGKHLAPSVILTGECVLNTSNLYLHTGCTATHSGPLCCDWTSSTAWELKSASLCKQRLCGALPSCSDS